jgi:TolB protein
MNRQKGGDMSESRKTRGATAVALAASILLTLALSSAAAAQKGRIVFISDRSGSWQLYTINPDGSDLFQVTTLAPTDDDAWFPSISPDGQHIAFNYNAGNGPDLYVVNSDGSGLRQLTNDQSSIWPRWSPDGKTLVFTTASSVGTGVIATMAADGSGQRKVLTTDNWESVGGFYTPDGKHILFGSEIGGFVSAVWIMNANGSHPRRLTPAPLKGNPWGISPDGKHIVGYTNQDSPSALGNGTFVMNLDGSGLKHLAPLAKFHHDLYPSYSPDGKKIAFMSDRLSTDITRFTYGTFDLFTMNSDGSDVTDVAPAVASCPFDGNCVLPLWGADDSD